MFARKNKHVHVSLKIWTVISTWMVIIFKNLVRMSEDNPRHESSPSSAGRAVDWFQFSPDQIQLPFYRSQSANTYIAFNVILFRFRTSQKRFLLTFNQQHKMFVNHTHVACVLQSPKLKFMCQNCLELKI